MSVAPKLNLITPDEFDRMEKKEHLNYELIDGLIMMSPSPSREHQVVNHKLHLLLGNQLRQSKCQPLFELDVKFDGDVFKPDLMVFCDEEAELPEIIFEILSPSTRRKDLVIKTVKYEAAGIKEYWIIDPKVKVITVHDYVNQTAETYTIGDTICSIARPEIIINIADIFV